MGLNAEIKCLDKDEPDVTWKLKLANTYSDDKIVKVLYCLVFHLVFKRYVPSETIIFSLFDPFKKGIQNPYFSTSGNIIK